MKINDFFKSTLGANLKNPRWSWGAYNPITNRLYLRVWRDQIEFIDGKELVKILKKNPKKFAAGYNERKNQVESLLLNIDGYGVVCDAEYDPKTNKRSIKNYDQEYVLELGEIIETKQSVFAEVKNRIPINKLKYQQTSSSTLLTDIKSILNKKIDITTKESLVLSRVGQGQFRQQVLNMWNNQCCVTHSKILDAIRASHIKPWSKSTDYERMDPFNGLPLIATLDSLFDAGLITFLSDGKMKVSKKVSETQIKILGLKKLSLFKKPNRRLDHYLEYHRQNIFINK